MKICFSGTRKSIKIYQFKPSLKNWVKVPLCKKESLNVLFELDTGLLNVSLREMNPALNVEFFCITVCKDPGAIVSDS